MDDHHITSLDAALPLPHTLRDFRKPDTASAPSLRLIAGYEVLQELGRGGMGIVYLARQGQLGRLVALKMVPSPNASREELIRFRQEAEAVAALSHPGIVPIYEVGEHDGMPFYTMAYQPGGSLEEALDGRPMGPIAAATLLASLADAVHHAHQRGILHRDLKPANVLLTEEGLPRVADFGLARRLDEQGDRATRSGAIVGTPAYMAPEQALGNKGLGPGVDVWSMGVILYEMLTGRRPFQGETLLQTLEHVRQQEPLAPQMLSPEVPADLGTICLKCLEKEPGRRYQSAAELADDLRRWLAGVPVRARPAGPIEQAWKWANRHPTTAGLIAVSVLLVAVLTAALPLHILRLREEVDRAKAEALEAHESHRRAVLLAECEAQVSEGKRLLEGGAALQRAALAFGTVFDLIRDQDARAEPALWKLKAEARALRDEAVRLHTHGERRRQEEKKAERFLALRDEAFFRLHCNLLGEQARPANDFDGANIAQKALAAFPDVEALPTQRGEQLRQAGTELVFILAEFWARSCHPLLAVKLLEELGDDAPRAVHLRLARYLDMVDRPDEAERQRALARKAVPSRAIDWFLSAQERIQAGDRRGARDDLDRALKASKTMFWAHFLRGQVQRELGNRGEARFEMTWCISARPRFVWPYLLRAVMYIEEKKYKEAEADLKEASALKLTPAGEYLLFVNRGVLALARRRPGEAAKYFARAIEKWPQPYHAYANLARAEWEMGERESAYRRLDRAVALAPDDPEVYRRRAWLRAAGKRYYDALLDIDRALKLGGNEPGDLRERARLLYLQGRHEDALRAVDVALKREPDSPAGLRLRAEVLVELGRNKEALKAFAAFLKVGEPDADLFARRARARASLRDLYGVIDDYSRALSLRRDGPLLCARGRAFLANRAPHLALVDFEKALEKFPPSAEAFIGRATARLELGKPAGAQADLDHALRARPREPWLLYAAARGYARLGRGAEASSRKCRDKALIVLEAALVALPPSKRAAFWREQVARDPALACLADLPEFSRLRRHYEGR
jgi:tetratricopeptide (TPR) repeat protein